MALELPANRTATLAKIAKMSDAEISALKSALEALTLPTEKQTSLESVRHAVKPLEAQDVGDTLYDLYNIRESAGVSSKRFIKDLIDGLRRSKILDASSVTAIKDRLPQLLEIDSLKVLAKAYAIQREHQMVFCEAKLMSDIRPVFSDDAKVKPMGAVLSHTLKLTYHQNNEHREIFVALDRVDLNELKEVLDRAKEKSDTLETFLRASNLPILGT